MSSLKVRLFLMVFGITLDIIGLMWAPTNQGIFLSLIVLGTIFVLLPVVLSRPKKQKN